MSDGDDNDNDEAAPSSRLLSIVHFKNDGDSCDGAKLPEMYCVDKKLVWDWSYVLRSSKIGGSEGS